MAGCAGRPPPTGGGGVTDGRVVAPSPCVAGWCGVVPRLCAHFLPFQVVRRLAQVRPTVSVPRFGAVVCFGAPCCVVLCFAVLRGAALCCAAVRSALSCRAAPCYAMVCLAVAWQAPLCCAAPRCVVLCCVVSQGALLRRAAWHCAVLRCAVLPRVVPCFGVPLYVVGPLYLCSGVGWRRRWLDWSALLCGTQAKVMCLAGGPGVRLRVVRLVGSVLRRSGFAVRLGGSGGCPRGCPPWGPVRWTCVLWGSLPLGVCRVLWGRVSWSSRVCWVPSRLVPVPPYRPLSWVSRPCPLLPPVPVQLRLCGGPCCGRGRHLAVRVWWWAVRCSRRLPVCVAPSPRVDVPSFPCAGPGGRWTRPRAVRAASGPGCGSASWRACASGGRVVSTGWGVGAVLVLFLIRVRPGARCCALSPSATAPGLSFS